MTFTEGPLLMIPVPLWWRWRQCVTLAGVVSFFRVARDLRGYGLCNAVSIAWSCFWLLPEDWGVYANLPLPWCKRTLARDFQEAA